jgi:hypothetical protein
MLVQPSRLSNLLSSTSPSFRSLKLLRFWELLTLIIRYQFNKALHHPLDVDRQLPAICTAFVVESNSSAKQGTLNTTRMYAQYMSIIGDDARQTSVPPPTSLKLNGERSPTSHIRLPKQATTCGLRGRENIHHRGARLCVDHGNSTFSWSLVLPVLALMAIMAVSLDHHTTSMLGGMNLECAEYEHSCGIGSNKAISGDPLRQDDHGTKTRHEVTRTTPGS